MAGTGADSALPTSFEQTDRHESNPSHQDQSLIACALSPLAFPTGEPIDGSHRSSFSRARAGTPLRSRRRGASFARHPAQQDRGRRESRVPVAPAASRAKNNKHTSVVTTGSPERSGLPCAMVLTVSFVILCLPNLAECANGRFLPTARRWI